MCYGTDCYDTPKLFDIREISEGVWECGCCKTAFHIREDEQWVYEYCPKCGYDIGFWYALDKSKEKEIDHRQPV